MTKLSKWYTDRKVPTVKWMDNECFIAYVDDSANAVARMKSSSGPRIVLYGSVVITMFDFLEQIYKN